MARTACLPVGIHPSDMSHPDNLRRVLQFRLEQQLQYFKDNPLPKGTKEDDIYKLVEEYRGVEIVRQTKAAEYHNEGLKAVIKDLNIQNGKLRTQLEDKQKHIDEMLEFMTEKDDRIEDLMDFLSDKNTQLEDFAEEIEEKDNLIEDLEEANWDLEVEHRTLSNLVDTLEDTNMRLWKRVREQETVGKVYNTRSVAAKKQKIVGL